MQRNTAITIPMRGVFSDPEGGAGTFAGILSIMSFVREGGRIFAVGTLAGSLVDSRGEPLAGTARTAVRLPLDLVVPGVGEVPLFQVELLGQLVRLDRVVLGMTEPRSGQRPACPLDSPET